MVGSEARPASAAARSPWAGAVVGAGPESPEGGLLVVGSHGVGAGRTGVPGLAVGVLELGVVRKRAALRRRAARTMQAGMKPRP